MYLAAATAFIQRIKEKRNDVNQFHRRESRIKGGGNVKIRKQRYAFEFYVDGKDEWYWRRTNALVERKTKKMATLAGASITISAISIIISSFALLHK